MRKLILLTQLLALSISACISGSANAGRSNASLASPTKSIATPSQTPGIHRASAIHLATASSTPERKAADWKSWPVLPTVSAEMRELYQRGLESGNNPHAFSILGDCQSEPDVFMSRYDSDPEVVAALPAYLQETVAYFSGSFDRYSPTVKSGTTTGALLWGQWNDNEEGFCQEGETPLDCELRVHKPSIVFIHIGTHWETRNYKYLSIIVQKILDHGAVPVVVTKADDRERDDRVNLDYAMLAEEFGLPLWNFWATVQDLPDGGLLPAEDFLGTWKLSEEAQAIHRLSALEALDAVWQQVSDQ